MPASRRRRTYESPLRAEQVDRTRDKLVAAGVELVLAGSTDELTVRTVAAHAQVSVPTAYRYFPDRDAMLSAIGLSISRRVSSVSVPPDFDDLERWARAMAMTFEANSSIMRAQVATPIGRSVRAQAMRVRNAETLELVKRTSPGVPEEQCRRFCAALRAVMSLDTWVAFRDSWDFPPAEAAHIAGWAAATLLAEFRRAPAGLRMSGNAPATEAGENPAGKPAKRPRRAKPGAAGRA